MENLKRYSGLALVAMVAAFVGVFAYARFFEKQPSYYASENQPPVQMVGLREGGAIDFTVAAERTVHAVVHVRVKSGRNEAMNNPLYEFFYGNQPQRPEQASGFGSGVIVSNDGYIITNNHVVEKADEISVKLNDNREFTAELIGTDPSTDLALLRIKAKDLPYVPFGNSETLKIGEWVLAVGNPFNLTSTVTAGIVSAKARNLGILPDKYRIESFIQTDAALNPGNSGGALVNTLGELVGINSAILSPNGGYAGNSFAIPVTIVKKVYDDLREFGVVQRAVLGISIQDVNADIARQKNLDKISGILVSGVNEEGAAKDAGIKEGDILIKVNDIRVGNTSELQEQISKYRPNQKVKVTVIRDNKEKEFELTLKNLNGDTKVVKNDIGLSVLGATFAEISKTDMRKLGIQNGVKVIEVGPGKFRKAGIQKGFIIIAVNDKPVSTIDDIQKIINSNPDGVFIKGIFPDGVIGYFAFGMN